MKYFFFKVFVHPGGLGLGLGETVEFVDVIGCMQDHLICHWAQPSLRPFAQFYVRILFVNIVDVRMSKHYGKNKRSARLLLTAFARPRKERKSFKKN